MSLGPGIFVAIVGPSGVGKDSLIRALGQRMREGDGIVLARRVVTRAADAHEDHGTLDEPAFFAARAEGRFALSWSAHGLYYGVPMEIDAAINAGKTVVSNVSRTIVADMRARYRRSVVVCVTASAQTLAARLAARGRESAEARHGRMERGKSPEIAFVLDRILDNDGPLEDASARLFEIVMSCGADANA